MPPDAIYSLSDLASLAGVTPRTVRYYIAQGLLASPAQFGPATRYAEAHLDRLRLIRQLQREHLPLADIRARLAAMGDDEVAGLVEQPRVPRTAESAVDYIRSVLAGPMPAADTAVAPALPPPDPTAAAAAEPPSTQPDRSQWDRILLAPDIELHVRRPLSRLQNRRVERLIAIARELLEEDRP